MVEKEFNLLDEKWILVMKKSGEVEEVSLLDVFSCAHEFSCLAGETVHQDAAMLRYLLSYLFSVFQKYDIHGNESMIATQEDALARWQSLHEHGSFDIPVLREYLERFRDRHYLFHPIHPFYQVPLPGKATEYTAAKLNGAILQSGDGAAVSRTRIFALRAGRTKYRLTYPEAARWLITLNGYDDSSGKPQKKVFDENGERVKLPSPGIGWLGQLGLVYATGSNLFETLLLNLAFLKDGQYVWDYAPPVWESPVKDDERTEIPMPEGPAALLTLQSRRIQLVAENGYVMKCKLLGGDFFTGFNLFNEQMTLWKNTAKKDGVPKFRPKRHDPAIQMWRNMASLSSQDDDFHRPGIVSWISRLRNEGIISNIPVRLQAVSVIYDSKNCSVVDVYGDTMMLNTDLLSAPGKEWMDRIIQEVKYTEKLVDYLEWFANDIGKAAGGSSSYSGGRSAKEEAYFIIDKPFRKWIASINLASDKNTVCAEWRKFVKFTVLRIGEDVITNAGPSAFTGRIMKEKINDKVIERRLIGPELYNDYIARVCNYQNIM
jgi:CRISPR system Cascade subunit CasA